MSDMNVLHSALAAMLTLRKRGWGYQELTLDEKKIQDGYGTPVDEMSNKCLLNSPSTEIRVLLPVIKIC